MPVWSVATSPLTERVFIPTFGQAPVYLFSVLSGLGVVLLVGATDVHWRRGLGAQAD